MPSFGELEVLVLHARFKRAGVLEWVIMQTTGHKSVEMVLRYVRAANQFKENAVNALGL